MTAAATARLNEAAITAFNAVDEANGKLSCPRVVLSSSPFNLCCLNNFVDCCIVTIAVAAAACLNLINVNEQEQLIVELEELSLAGTNTPANDGSDADAQNNGADNEHNHCDDAANDSSMDGLRWMGRRLHRFDDLEDIFDNFVDEVEWGNEDYDHNPEVANDGHYAPDE